LNFRSTQRQLGALQGWMASSYISYGLEAEKVRA